MLRLNIFLLFINRRGIIKKERLASAGQKPCKERKDINIIYLHSFLQILCRHSGSSYICTVVFS